MLKLDHIVVAVPNLKDAINFIKNNTGYSPVYGGKHEKLGTHNALLGLGQKNHRQYLELIAIDPERDPNITSFPFGLKENNNDIYVVAWALQCDDLDKTLLTMSNLGNDHKYDKPNSGQRIRSDGSVVRWKSAHNSQQFTAKKGTCPFLISWADNNLHPSQFFSDENMCPLISFTIYSPDATNQQEQLKKAGVVDQVKFKQSDSYDFEVVLCGKEQLLVLSSKPYRASIESSQSQKLTAKL